jgi:hypothetical protein
MADCLHVGANTESNVKSLTAGMFDFSGFGFFTSIRLSLSCTCTISSWSAATSFLLGGLHLTTTLTVYVFDAAFSLGGILNPEQNVLKINLKIHCVHVLTKKLSFLNSVITCKLIMIHCFH